MAGTAEDAVSLLGDEGVERDEGSRGQGLGRGCEIMGPVLRAAGCAGGFEDGDEGADGGFGAAQDRDGGSGSFGAVVDFGVDLEVSASALFKMLITPLPPLRCNRK